MRESTCPSLRLLGHLLKTAYRLRDDCIANLKSKNELDHAEMNLRNAHELLTRHRTLCSRCKLNDTLLDARQDNHGWRFKITGTDLTQ